MTNININLAKKLDGSNPYMAAAFIDSYGKVLLQEITLNDIQGDCKLLIENPFTPCAYCGIPVVDSSIMPGSNGMCDNCYKAGPNQPDTCKAINHNMCMQCEHDENCSRQESNFGKNTSLLLEGLGSILNETTGDLTMEERIKPAVYMASDIFWKTIADHFPECKTGDLEPNYVFKMEETMEEVVRHWVDNNVPKPESKPCNRPESNEKPEYWAVEHGLHYQDIWHNHQTGGGCMVVTSDNVVVAGEHRYLGITSECVVVYTDTFEDDAFLNVWDEANTWSFGDNPTVLMNIIDQAFGGNALWNTGHLFDDIMTIAKCGVC